MPVFTNHIAEDARTQLVDRVLPWWLQYAVDPAYGGIRTMISEQGEILGDDKFVWSQARWLWVASAVCNRLGGSQALAETAERTAAFLRRFGQGEDGCWNYRVRRDGAVVEGATSIFSDCFAVYSLSEYFRLSGEPWALSLAMDTFRSICARTDSPSFQAIAPYTMRPGTRAHAVPMILLETAQELSISFGGSNEVDAVADACFDAVLQRFVQPGSGLVLEYLNRDYTLLDTPEGALVVPGHAIECMWFLAHLSLRRRGGKALDRLGALTLRHLEFGWDTVHGGLFLNGSAQGNFEAYPHGQMKLWWPHTEALYTTALLYHVTGDQRYRDWYERVNVWSRDHFEMPSGEWRQRLLRDGTPSEKTVALPVKDPFHLPRTLLNLATLPQSFVASPPEAALVGSSTLGGVSSMLEADGSRGGSAAN